MESPKKEKNIPQSKSGIKCSANRIQINPFLSEVSLRYSGKNLMALCDNPIANKGVNNVAALRINAA